MTAEGDVKRRFREGLEQLGPRVDGVWFTGDNDRGVADYIGAVAGVPFLVEFKAPTGRFKGIQTLRGLRMSQAGFIRHSAYNYAQVDDVLSWIKAHIDSAVMLESMEYALQSR